MLTTLLFFVGFPVLIGGADLLVRGASSVARRLGISELVVGLTIVSIGTSAPEMVVSVLASFRGSNDLALGNIVGSNIANILLILGAAALVAPLTMAPSTARIEIPISVGAALLLYVLLNDRIFGFGSVGHLPPTFAGELQRTDGILLLGGFLAFLLYALWSSKRPTSDPTPELPPSEPSAESTSSEDLSMRTALILIPLGALALMIGGQWIVDGAVLIAKSFGMSEKVIGLTIIAVGTSLPELATSVVAAWKGQNDIAIGNVVGSNIFNIFWILGFSATIRPLAFNPGMNSDIYVLFATSALLLLFSFAFGKYTIQRSKGALFLLLYAGYTAFLLWKK